MICPLLSVSYGRAWQIPFMLQSFRPRPSSHGVPVAERSRSWISKDFRWLVGGVNGKFVVRIEALQGWA